MNRPVLVRVRREEVAAEARLDPAVLRLDAPPEPGPRLPLSLLACLPLLWSRVLFPGRSARPGPWRWRSLVLLAALTGLLLYPCLSFPLFEPDEGRYAQIPAEMFARGEWIVPTLQSEPYLDKPPLLYWLVMGAYALFGVHDWAARLAPALAVQAVVLLTYFLGRRRVGERAAWWGALALGLAPGFLGMGRLVLHDGVLALWVTLGFFAAWEALAGDRLRWGWWLTAALACGLGVLTKGPVVLVLIGPPLWLHRRLTRSGPAVGWRPLLAFAAVVLAVALPWYAAVCLRMPGFAGYFLWRHNVVRFVQPFDHREPIWYYGPILLIGLLPASLLLPALGRFLLSGKAGLAGRRTPELGLLLLTGGWVVLFFSLSGCKLVTYIVPAFPPLALALGTFIASGRWDRSRWTRAVCGVSVLLMAVGHYVAVPWCASDRSPVQCLEQLRARCGNSHTPVACFPRPLDSAAFYLGRDDFHSFRGKEAAQLVQFLRDQRRTVVLLTRSHSLDQLRRMLPAELRLTEALHTAPKTNLVRATEVGLCDLAVVERRP